MKSVGMLVCDIREAGEDFEWYPTTPEIVSALQMHIISELGARSLGSILDIGCGNGSFLERFGNADKFRYIRKYGMEKSNILAEQLPDDIVLLGSDFMENTLIDKQVDMIYCNPPYSEYDSWAEKIVLEGNARYIALVLPVRWRNSDRMQDALRRRNYQADIVGTYDFSNAERRARATVDLIFISARKVLYNGRHHSQQVNDPFGVWFDQTFKMSADISRQHESSYRESVEQEVKNEMVAHGDTAETLVRCYNRDMESLYSNYRQLERLDHELFRELKIDVPMLKESLRKRLEGLKHIYWNMLFQRYDKITSRLTSTGRRKVTQRLNDNTAIDFTMSNIVQLTLWIIRHSNTLFEEQISEYFYNLCSPECIHRYKSNKRWNDDDWRYIKDTFDENCWMSRSERKERAKKCTHLQLDYRIVVKGDYNFEWHREGLSDSCIEFLSDTAIIGSNLGFDLILELPNRYSIVDIECWKNFNIETKDGKLFANVKLYKNGNRHVKFCKEFMRRLNVEMARIHGWVQDKREAMDELDMTMDEINSAWGSNLQMSLACSTEFLGLPDANQTGHPA